MEQKNSALKKLAARFDKEQFKILHEEMSFNDYINRVYEKPLLARTAYQRIYDMIMSKGSYEFEKHRKVFTHYNFFDNEEIPIFGLEQSLDSLVKFIRGAAGGYGTEKRVLLLHGPVGSSKSTIARRLKRGLEEYSRTPEGALYTYKWVDLPTGDDGIYTHKEDMCPMREDPLKLILPKDRQRLLDELNEINKDNTPEEKRNMIYTLRCEGELCPRCKKFMEELMVRNDGDWEAVVTKHIRVVRLVFSESDRVGIATFQPKDEKNQDATELTGDINFGKLPHYGSDSDARAFNFDGEFCIGNRGMVEFIEMLKLAQEFLYDLLGASQERQIKPKKFAQISVDEMILGHSVHGDTPIPHEYNGVLDVLPISKMSNLDVSKLRVFSVNMEMRQVELTEVKSVFSHDFNGEWIRNEQDDDQLTTTPNHSVYNKNYETFYPGEDETSEILTVEIPNYLVVGKQLSDRWIAFFSSNEFANSYSG